MRWVRYFFIGLFSFFFACAPARQELNLTQELAQEEKLVELLSVATLEMRQKTTAAYSRALAALELAREMSARDPRVLDALGCVEWRRKNYNLAEYFFRETLRENPNYDRAYAHMAMIAERKGDIKAAQELLLYALQLNPMNYRARNNFAALLIDHKAKDRKSSQKAYDELLKVYQSGAAEDPVLEYNLELLQ